MTPLSNIVNTGTGCPTFVVCLCKWTQLMVILLKALCITYEVFFNFKAFHVCGLSNVPWISCAKYLSFDDKREITQVIHVSTLITTIFVSKTNCNQFQRITSFLHLHRQNPAQSCLRMSRHGAQDVMARSRVTCHMLPSVTCEVLAGREVAADWGISPPASHHRHQRVIVRSSLVMWNDPSVSQSVFTITEKAPTRVESTHSY